VAGLARAYIKFCIRFLLKVWYRVIHRFLNISPKAFKSQNIFGHFSKKLIAIVKHTLLLQSISQTPKRRKLGSDVSIKSTQIVKCLPQLSKQLLGHCCKSHHPSPCLRGKREILTRDNLKSFQIYMKHFILTALRVS